MIRVVKNSFSTPSMVSRPLRSGLTTAPDGWLSTNRRAASASFVISVSGTWNPRRSAADSCAGLDDAAAFRSG